MNRTLLWRDLRALSKDLHDTLSADHGKQTASLSYCMDVVGELNKRFDQHPTPTHTLARGERGSFVFGGEAKTQSLLLGVLRSKDVSKKKVPLHLTPQAALGQVMVIGCTGSGRTETLLNMASNAAADKKGVFYLDCKGDNSLYVRTFARLSESGRVGDLRVINLMTGFRVPGNDKKIGHTLDLFQGMDWQALSSWMQHVSPLPEQKDERKAFVDLLSDLCPKVSRLLFYWSAHTGKKITPSLVAMGLTYDGMRMLMDELPDSDKVQHQPLMKVTEDPQGLTCLALSVLSTHLLPLSLSWGHVFESDRPEVGLLDSIKANHFVLVLAPALHKMNNQARVIATAITASLHQAMKSLPASRSFDELLILDDFIEYSSDPLVCALSGLRNRGAGVVWGVEGPPSAKQRRAWSENTTPWQAPNTHVVMKQCSDHFDASYFQWQSSQHEALSLGVPALGNLEDLEPGEAVVYSGVCLHEVVMDYKAPQVPGKLFIPFANPLVTEKVLPPGPMKILPRAASRRDSNKQAAILLERLVEFNEIDTARGSPPKLSWCQETVARMMGFAHWHEAKVRCAPVDE